MDNLFQKNVYYVSCNTDDTVLLAFKPKVLGEYLHWYDSNKERVMKIKNLYRQESVNKILLIRGDGAKKDCVYVFEPLNIELYNKFVKSKLLSPMHFDSEQQMLQRFYDEFKDYDL